jgi:hypothetical protein
MAITTNNPPVLGSRDDAAERDTALRLAERYRCPFVDLTEQRIDPELFRSIPAELMFRYNFVPLESRETTLVVAMADPSQLQLRSTNLRASGQAPADQRSPPPRRSATC